MIVIIYLLSQEGQRAHLRAGGNGAMRQTFHLPPDERMLWEQALSMAEIAPDGKGTVRIGHSDRAGKHHGKRLSLSVDSMTIVEHHDAPTTWDGPQQLSDLLAWEGHYRATLAVVNQRARETQAGHLTSDRRRRIEIALSRAIELMGRVPDALATHEIVRALKQRPLDPDGTDLDALRDQVEELDRLMLAYTTASQFHEQIEQGGEPALLDLPEMKALRGALEDRDVRSGALTCGKMSAIVAVQIATAEIEIGRYEHIRENWIGSHGSERLRRIVSEGLIGGSDDLYREERLRRERPGYVWKNAIRGDGLAPTKPVQAGFILLDRARQHDPSARLVHWIVPHEHDRAAVFPRFGTCTGYEPRLGRCPTYDWTGCVAVAEFMGVTIVYFGTATLPKEVAA